MMKRLAVWLLVVCAAVGFAGCAAKATQMDAMGIVGTFRIEAGNAGFGVSTYTTDLPAQAAYIARKGGCEIVLLVFENNRQAESFVESLSEFLGELADGADVKSTSSSDHATYRLATGEEYFQLSRAYHTVLFAGGPLEYEDEIKALYKALHY